MPLIVPGVHYGKPFLTSGVETPWSDALEPATGRTLAVHIINTKDKIRSRFLLDLSPAAEHRPAKTLVQDRRKRLAALLTKTGDMTSPEMDFRFKVIKRFKTTTCFAFATST